MESLLSFPATAEVGGGMSALARGIAPFVGLLGAAAFALGVFSRSLGSARTARTTRLGVALAVGGLVAGMLALSTMRTAHDWLGDALGATLVAAGLAHRELWRRAPTERIGSGGRALVGWIGLAAAALCALLAIRPGGFPADTSSAESNLQGALALLTALVGASWIALPLLSRPPLEVMHEGHPAPALRNACPRCGRCSTAAPAARLVRSAG